MFGIHGHEIGLRIHAQAIAVEPQRLGAASVTTSSNQQFLVGVETGSITDHRSPIEPSAIPLPVDRRSMSDGNDA
jgi:hypothetical protein